MKKLTLKTIIFSLLAIVAFNYSYAQSTQKDLKKNLKSSIERDCRKTAKKLKKDNWEVLPGKLPLSRQIQDSRYAQLSLNEDGKQEFIIGTHIAKGGNYSAAKKIASSRALTELAEQVNSKVDEIIKSNVANTNYGEGDMEVIDKCISANKHVVSARLNGATPILEIFRRGDNGTYEVQVMYKISAKEAIRTAKNAYRTELKKESEDLANELDELLKY
ncbi:MAG: hypothetical protein IMY73_03980 [Bacteroidetes bacterium]|nr:hypothetical protein [Bacteroidota bacterium]